MKNENKTTRVLILIFPGKNALWNHRKSLKNGSAKVYKSLITFADQVFILKMAIKKRFAKFQDLNKSEYEILHTKIYFFRLLHTSTSKVTNKEKTCFVCAWKFQFFVIFTGFKGKKQYANPGPLKFLARYVEVHDKTRMPSYKKLKNMWKRDYIAFIN